MADALERWPDSRTGSHGGEVGALLSVIESVDAININECSWYRISVRVGVLTEGEFSVGGWIHLS